MEPNQKKANGLALIPFAVFVGVYLATGITLNAMGVEMAFYQLPTPIASFIGIIVAFAMFKGKFDDKLSVFLHGCGEENIMIMCMVFLFAGAFTSVSSAMGGVDSVVNLGMTFIPPQFIAAGVFVISAFISISTGTSVGTVTAVTPIALGLAQAGGLNQFLVVGATIGGSMFGDNLSMISDTTIAAVKTQGCDMKDKFKANFLLVLPAAVLSILIFWIMTRNVSYSLEGDLKYNLWEVFPYLIVLAGALAGINVFLVLISGIVISLIVGVAAGNIAVTEMFKVVGDGVTSMYDITVISILVACIVSLVKEAGGIQFILDLIKSRIRGKKGAELGIALLALFVDICTANNTVAIVMTGPIAREISEEYGVDPKRSASLLDMFTSVGQGMIPYGAQLLSAATLTGLTPVDILPNLYYPVLMGICGVGAIFLRKR